MSAEKTLWEANTPNIDKRKLTFLAITTLSAIFATSALNPESVMAQNQASNVINPEQTEVKPGVEQSGNKNLLEKIGNIINPGMNMTQSERRVAAGAEASNLRTRFILNYGSSSHSRQFNSWHDYQNAMREAINQEIAYRNSRGVGLGDISEVMSQLGIQ